MNWEPLQIDKATLQEDATLDEQYARHMAMRDYGVAAACIGKPVEMLTDYEKAAVATVAGCPTAIDSTSGIAALVFSIKDLPGTEGVGFVVAYKDNGGMGQVVTIKAKE